MCSPFALPSPTTIMAILRLFLAAGTTVALYGAYKLGVQLLAPYFSPLRDLPGPKSKSFIWGNLGEIRKAENSKLHEEWIEKYGKVIKYKGFFNVSCIVPSSVKFERTPLISLDRPTGCTQRICAL